MVLDSDDTLWTSVGLHDTTLELAVGVPFSDDV